MEIEQTIGDNFSGTKNITVSTGGGSARSGLPIEG